MSQLNRRNVRIRALTLLIVGGCALTACGGAASSIPQTRANGSADINPRPRDQVRDGGVLRLALSLLPSNFNINQVDGPNVDMKTIDEAVLPKAFDATADGGFAVNTDLLTSAALTSTNPQVITYTINPKAVWTDGTPITWRDFQAYWQALNGRNPAYLVAGTNGYSDITSVTRGVDDRQAVVTFGTPYGEWKSLFVPLTPASLNSDPNAFNTAWRTGMPTTAGPFSVQSVDQIRKNVILARNPRWWGTPAKLDSIQLQYYDTSALPDALANHELDLMGVGAILDLLRRAQTTPGVSIRGAPGRYAFNVTLNGAPGSPLADLPLRQAVAQSIDRAEIVRRVLGQVAPGAKPDGSHVYAPGEKEYRDNADALPYDPAHAQRILDQLGWSRPTPNAPRGRAGTPLSLRLVFAQDATNLGLAKTLQDQLGQVGITVVLDQVDPNQLFPTYVDRGNFDLALLGWQSTPAPFSDGAGIYQLPSGDNVRQNYGRIGSTQIDALITQGLAELDDTKRAEIGNQVDRLIWQEAHSVILMAVPGIRAARSTVANLGSPGFADPDFINAGFVK